MAATSIAIHRTGLVTSVGGTGASACAAIRAKLTNPTETRFRVSGEWLMAHQMPWENKPNGRALLCRMATLAIRQAMAGIPEDSWPKVPLILCVAERGRPGRADGVEDALFEEIQVEAGARFAPQSAVVPWGRVSVLIALAQARTLIASKAVEHVLIAATDSYLSWPTLSHYEQNGRLLTTTNSNGFMPGEAAAALLVSEQGDDAGLVCTGIGFGDEKSHIDSGEPLRAEGLERSMKAALAEANLPMHEIDYRITDLSGEQYYFKEASLALSRSMRQRKERLDIWHPAECTGETGSAIGGIAIALADAAARKGFSEGRTVLTHMGNDAGQRACAVFRWNGAQ